MFLHFLNYWKNFPVKLILLVGLFKSIECVTQLFPVHLNGNGSSAPFSRYQLNHKFSSDSNNNNIYNDYGSLGAEDITSSNNNNNFGYYNHNRGGKAYAGPGLNSNSLNGHHDSSSLWSSNEDVGGGGQSSAISSSPPILDTSGGSAGTVSRGEAYNSGGDLATAADGHILGYGHGWNNYGHNHHHHHGGGGWGGAGGYPKTYHYQIYPVKGHHHGHHHHHHNVGWGGWQNYDQGWGEYGHELWDKFSGWLGLKGVNVVSFFKSLLIAIPLILGLLLLLLFLPIPVFLQTSAFCARTNSANKLWQETGRLTRDILTSEECVERISCELTRVASKYDKTQWIQGILKNIPKSMKSKWLDRISTTVDHEGKLISKDIKCSKFSCNPLSHIKKTFKLE